MVSLILVSSGFIELRPLFFGLLGVVCLRWVRLILFVCLFVSLFFCLFQNVFRCYDSRFRPTYRCTAIYENAREIFGIDNPKRTMVGPAYIYEDQLPNIRQTESLYSESLIWKFSGQLIILEIPFIDGDHRPRRMGDFLPIIDELTRMHEKSYVHGDIRLYIWFSPMRTGGR